MSSLTGNVGGESTELAEFRTEHSENRTEKSEIWHMSAVAEASSLLRRVAEPRPAGDTVKAAINRAARRVSAHLLHPMKASRAEDIWRSEARAIRAEEMDAIRKAAAADRYAEEARDDHARLLDRISRIETALRISDPEFHREQADALRAAAGRVDRSVDRDGE